MRDSSFELWERVTHLSIGFAFVVSACFGIFGYSTFTTFSQGKENYVKNYMSDALKRRQKKEAFEHSQLV